MNNLRKNVEELYYKSCFKSFEPKIEDSLSAPNHSDKIIHYDIYKSTAYYFDEYKNTCCYYPLTLEQQIIQKLNEAIKIQKENYRILYELYMKIYKDNNYYIDENHIGNNADYKNNDIITLIEQKYIIKL